MWGEHPAAQENSGYLQPVQGGTLGVGGSPRTSPDTDTVTKKKAYPGTILPLI
jgi:hypothetical protein